MTRIVAGTAGGRRIAVPRKGTRPTSERVREALFNALESAVDLDGARVLDLYAGSGALGLEALSRGAAHATFVESDPGALAVLAGNIRILGFAATTVLRARVGAVLAGPAPEPFDVVLADPPYAVDAVALAAELAALPAHGWTGAGSLVVVERSRRGAAPRWPAPLAGTRVRRYGDTELHWARHGGDPVE